MSEPITKQLRDYVDKYLPHGTAACGILAIADEVDAEHGRRMEDCRREVRRDVVRYIRGVLNDYDHNVKRVRKCDKTEVVRCRDCEYAIDVDVDCYICVGFASCRVSGDEYCARGERANDGEK